jgi:hypothetical protein
MWHIMEKVHEKVSLPTNHDKEFWAALNNCVWGSEIREEFQMRWNAIIPAYGLESNEWLANRYQMKGSIIMDSSILYGYTSCRCAKNYFKV